MYRKGMFRHLEVLTCASRTNRKAMTEWLLHEYSLGIRALPGLKDLRIYITHEQSIFGPPFCDSFVECYFQDRSALDKAAKTDTMTAHIEELGRRGFVRGSNLQIVWAEENIIEIPAGPRKMHGESGKFCQMGTLRCSPGMSVTELRRWWLEEHAETGKHLLGLKWYTVLFPIRDTPWGPPPFDGYASVWYDSVSELKAAAASKIMQGQMQDVRRHNMDSPELSKVVLADEHISAIELNTGEEDR